MINKDHRGWPRIFSNRLRRRSSLLHLLCIYYTKSECRQFISLRVVAWPSTSPASVCFTFCRHVCPSSCSSRNVSHPSMFRLIQFLFHFFVGSIISPYRLSVRKITGCILGFNCRKYELGSKIKRVKLRWTFSSADCFYQINLLVI